MAGAKVTGSGVLDMKLLAAQLKEADPALKRGLRKNFRDAASPVAEDVRQSILAMPSRHDGTLRAETARTITLSTSITRNGIRVQVSSLGNRMPAGKSTLPRHLDSVRGWNHPVWGRGPRSRWHWTKRRQHGKPQWFERPIALNAREFQAAARQALNEVQRKLGA
jgi:hypothetical protein